MRDEFNLKTKESLAKRVGYKCSNPECRVNTIGSNSNEEKSTSIGVAAHICAASKGGPRYDSDQSSDERSSYGNGIWLCTSCSVIIDRDPIKYTKEELVKWKNISEYLSTTELNKSQISNSDFTNQIDSLLKLREPLLNSIRTTKKKMRGAEILSSELLIGKDAFYLIFKSLRIKTKRVGNNEDKINVIKQWFKPPNDLHQYFQNLFSILEFIDAHKHHPYYESTKKSFVHQIIYFEQVLLFYYLLAVEDKDRSELINKFEIVGELNKEDLLLKSN